MFPTEKVNRNKLKIYTFLMEAGQHTSGACRHGKSIKLESHFLTNTRMQSDREREGERDMLCDEGK